MDVGQSRDTTRADLKQRAAPAWRRALESAAEAWRRRASARAAARSARPVPDVQVARSRVEASLDARLAVRAGVRLEDFLRHRLARYASRLTIPLEDLPVSIDVEGGEPVVRARASSPAAPTYTGPTYAPAHSRADEAGRWTKALVEREGPFAAEQLHDVREEIDALDARAASAREHADAVARELEDDLNRGIVPSPLRVDATPEQLGRPPVPGAAPVVALHASALALLVAEAWFFAGPILGAQGVAQDDVLAAAEARPLTVAMSLVFALGASAAVFAFGAIAFARGSELLKEARDGRRLAATILASLLSAGGAIAAVSPGASMRLVAVVLVPFAGAALLGVATHLGESRGAALVAALAWDRAFARDVAERGRRTELVEAARAELERAEAERAAARRRLRALEKAAVDADHAAAHRAREDARRLDRIAESFAAALELDRYAFLKISAEATADALVRPAIRRLEPAVAPERVGIAR